MEGVPLKNSYYKTNGLLHVYFVMHSFPKGLLTFELICRKLVYNTKDFGNQMILGFTGSYIKNYLLCNKLNCSLECSTQH